MWMDQFLDHRNRATPHPHNRTLRVEQLEDRSLLSGVPLLANPVAAPPPPAAADMVLTSPASTPVVTSASTAGLNGTVEVVEWGSALPPRDSTLQLAIPELPLDDVAAAHPPLAGAELGEVRLNAADGAPELPLSTEFGGQPIEFAPNGQIMTVAQPLALAENARLMFDWIQTNFPGAALGEAAVEFNIANGTSVYLVNMEFNGRSIELALAFAPNGQIIAAAQTFILAEVPQSVLDGVQADYPGAALAETAVEFNIANGTSVYLVSVEFNGRSIELALAPDGQIIARAHTLILAEVPQPVFDWVQQDFPGAVVAEAEQVIIQGAVVYVVTITRPGQQDLEIAVYFQDTDSPPASLPGDQAADAGFAFVPTTAIVTTEGPPDSMPGAAPSEPAAAAQPEAAEMATPAAVALAPAREPKESAPADPVDTAVPMERRALDQVFAAAAAESVANEPPTAWLPQVAGAIGNLLPIDVAAVEQGLKQLLAEIDALAEQVASNPGVRVAAWRVAIAAALVTGAQLAILATKKDKYAPALASEDTNSSWSWVLGAALPERA